MAKRRTQVLREPTNSLYLSTPPQAVLVSSGGKRYPVDITPEAAEVWARFGFRVEWFAPVRESEAA